MQEENTQSQQQTQSQAINVSIQSSSDPLLEQRIFGQVASAGRQLARMADVIEVLVSDFEASAGDTMSPDTSKTINKFREMRKAILREKSRSSADQIMRQLASLRMADSEAYAALAPQLRSWLDNHAP